MNVKSMLKTAGVGLKQASPTIALVCGIAGGITAAVLACKATLKVDEVLEKSKEEVKQIHEIAEDPGKFNIVEYTEANKNRDLMKIYGKTIWGLAKIYGPALAAGTGSIVLIVGSHRVMLKRVATLGMACSMLGESLRRYRQNVSELYGEEKEHDIYYGLSNEKIDGIVVSEDGKEQKTKIKVKTISEERVVSPFAVFFDSDNPNYVKDDPVYNTDFISDSQRYMNDLLGRRGWVTLNEARMALGFKPTAEGQLYGWICKDCDPVCDGNKIDFGIDHIARDDVRAFRNGYEKVFIIDFNVDPEPIFELMHLFDKSNKAS